MSASFGEIRIFPQAHGADVRLQVFGDEFYARYETLDGYTCLYDAALSCYCYATLSDGRFASTGVPISAPPPAQQREHLKETRDVRNTLFDIRFEALKPPRPVAQGETIPEIFGPNAGLLTGRQLSSGQVRGLAILVDFKDVQTSITAAEVDALLNGEKYKANGNFCSVREYYRLMSSGALDYGNEVVGPFQLSHERRYYVDHLLVTEALDLAKAAGVDFSRFDSQGLNAIDAVSILYAGETVWEGSLWPHNSTVRWSSESLFLGGYRAGMYQITGLGNQASDLAIGTFCHESGHMLCRFPDLYDYGKRDGDFELSAGLGVYCLMSAGNHLDGGRTPSAICAYLRDLAGWCLEAKRVSLNDPGLHQAVHGAYDTAFVYQAPKSTEYFLIENRSRIGLDGHLPAGGLAIYHCDTQGSNERQAGTAGQHYQCRLLQADGRRDLEQNANQGDAGDFFGSIRGAALSATTTPATALWDSTDSGLRIADVSAPGETISFFVPHRSMNMSANGSSTELDPLALQHAKEQIEILQRNLELLKLSQQLEQEKAKAEVEKIKAAADRQKAAMDQIKALIPTGTTKPLSGETKVDEKYGYIAKLTVNKATENVAAAIAQEIRGGLIAPGAARIALVDSLDVCGDDIQALQAAKQIEALKTTLAAQAAKIDPLLTSLRAKGQPGAEVFIAGAALIPAVAQALAAAPGALSWAADIAAFFKPEDTYKSVDVALPLTALQVNVAGALRTPDAVTTFFPNFHTFGTLTDLPILKAFRECTEARRDLSAKAAELKILVEAAKAPADNSQPEVSAQIKLADAAVAALGSLTQAFDDFSKLMTTVPEGKSYSPLARAAMREYLKGTQKASHLLYLNVISSGGEVSIRKFLWSTRGIVFLGGCVVSYLLADVDGATLASGTLGRLAQTSYKRGQDDPLRFEALGG